MPPAPSIVTEANRRAIAARIRSLIDGQDHGDLASSARRLMVEELSLRLSVDDLSPHPTLEVIQAIVREYGVDPCWLLTGEYSIATHAKALGEEKPISHRGLRELIVQLSGDRRIDSAGLLQ